MDSRYIKELLTRYQENRCSPEEKEAVERMIVRGLKLEDVPEDEAARQEVWAALDKYVRHTQPNRRASLRRRVLQYAAAAAVVAVVVGVWFFNYRGERASVPRNDEVAIQDVAPGGDKAYLLLNDGSQIDLLAAANGKIADQSDQTITKTDEGVIAYKGSSTPAKSNDIVFNTLVTPRGGQYSIRLPDGSRVWMNAASSLKFPVNFENQKNRTVELRGEAYFEVAKDASRPFIVATPTQQVKVLGTHFNINSYADEKAVITTLLEGSVEILSLTQLNPTPLIPGQQAIHQDRIIKIQQADETAVSWKQGKIKFKDADLQAVMRQISRWYDLEVKYDGPISTGKFTGGISRNTNLSTVLEILELGGIRFSMESSANGKVLIVKNGK